MAGERQTLLIKKSGEILCKATIGVTIVETLLSLWVHFPLPLSPGTMLCYFLLPTTLNNSGTTLIRGKGEGVPERVLFGLFCLN